MEMLVAKDVKHSIHVQGFSITRVEKPDGGILSFTNYFVRNYVTCEMFLFIMHMVFLYQDASKEKERNLVGLWKYHVKQCVNMFKNG